MADGFDCLADLLPALEEYCSSPERDGRELYRVEFEFIG